ncbi:hypothetical protein OsI_16150 [Oryza sativa Indica Group]|uniref:Uncharacterized protein n=1 Tax=Oryza sativa subsp. indica TaxID=39946 RepID=B8AUP8_ORYSI|nr:hypothetical protein OsI_16150 [Oryza sativa Indica Group]
MAEGDNQGEREVVKKASTSTSSQALSMVIEGEGNEAAGSGALISGLRGSEAVMLIVGVVFGSVYAKNNSQTHSNPYANDE